MADDFRKLNAGLLEMLCIPEPEQVIRVTMSMRPTDWPLVTVVRRGKGDVGPVRTYRLKRDAAGELSLVPEGWAGRA